MCSGDDFGELLVIKSDRLSQIGTGILGFEIGTEVLEMEDQQARLSVAISVLDHISVDDSLYLDSILIPNSDNL